MAIFKKKKAITNPEATEHQKFLIELERLAKVAHEQRFFEYSIVLHALLMTLICPRAYLVSLTDSCMVLVDLMKEEIAKNKLQVH